MRALASALLVLLALAACGDPARALAPRAKHLGLSLCAAAVAQDDTARVHEAVAVGPDLRAKLRELGPKLAPGYGVEVLAGDPAPGDGSASHQVKLLAGSAAVLTVRLRYDAKVDAFHVLGFFTP